MSEKQVDFFQAVARGPREVVCPELTVRTA